MGSEHQFLPVQPILKFLLSMQKMTGTDRIELYTEPYAGGIQADQGKGCSPISIEAAVPGGRTGTWFECRT
jgi:hypothetical protein